MHTPDETIDVLIYVSPPPSSFIFDVDKSEVRK